MLPSCDGQSSGPGAAYPVLGPGPIRERSAVQPRAPTREGQQSPQQNPVAVPWVQGGGEPSITAGRSLSGQVAQHLLKAVEKYPLAPHQLDPSDLHGKPTGFVDLWKRPHLT